MPVARKYEFLIGVAAAILISEIVKPWYPLIPLRTDTVLDRFLYRLPTVLGTIIMIILFIFSCIRASILMEKRRGRECDNEDALFIVAGICVAHYFVRVGDIWLSGVFKLWADVEKFYAEDVSNSTEARVWGGFWFGNIVFLFCAVMFLLFEIVPFYQTFWPDSSARVTGNRIEFENRREALPKYTEEMV